MNIIAVVTKISASRLLYALAVCTALVASPVARATPFWGAHVNLSTSTCGGEVANHSTNNPQGDPGADLESTSSQYACGGQYGYAGDLPYAYTRAIADIGTGSLGVYAQVDGLGTQLTWSGNIITAPVAYAGFSASLRDLLTFTVPAHTPGSIIFTTTVDGSYTPEIGAMQFSMGGDVSCISNSCWGNLSGNWSAELWGIDNGGGPTSVYTRTINVADTDLPVIFDYSLGMSLSGRAEPFAGVNWGVPNVGSGTVDYLHTAALGIALPDGVHFASESGQLLSAVPVPAAAWLFGSALGLLGWLRRGTA